MADVRIGLDFGTHQTKICIQMTPDEGHGLPEYEFMQFKDLKGELHYFIPSVIQINNDGTLSYGFIDPTKEKDHNARPKLQRISGLANFDINEEAENLYYKYSVDMKNKEEGIDVIKRMLVKKEETDKKRYEKEKNIARREYESAMDEYRHSRNVFRYFKQATFSEYHWVGKYDPKFLCIWYLTYIIFLIEERFGDAFSINLGVPTDDKTFESKKHLGCQIIRSAFHLVEEVYNNDMDLFLKENISSLIENTRLFDYSDEDKEEFRIQVFPEAYASLISLTSRRKLSEGMSLNADIGGGTTDISFFVVNKGKPKIYKYWSLPYGLNYIAEQSGFDYADSDFVNNALDDVLDDFNAKKKNIVIELERELLIKARNSSIDKSNILNAMRSRVVVYNGGGSTYDNISIEFPHFNDVKMSTVELWEGEIIKDKNKVSKYVNILTTSYGLSISEDDDKVELCDFESLISDSNKESIYERPEIDKDVC